MRYTLRQLEVFLATAGHENISRAAESLAMSQSAASGSLKELEQQFEVQLFDRVGERLQLSELGRQLRPAADRL
jgi:DNA-binding transcriptional LysR family regulator